MSESLYFAQRTLQEVALAIMGVVYITRLIWLTRFMAGKERQAVTGKGSLKPNKSIFYSWANVGMPWAMESTRKNMFLYIQFVIFHLGVIAAIGLSFVIPYAPEILTPTVVTIIQVTCGAACLVGVLRIIRRIGSVYVRAISSPDDHFSIWLMTVWFAFATLAAPNNWAAGETILMIYFYMTAFFLIYVPFSKISHYLYYPFTRYYLGKTLGRRGVMPMSKAQQQ